MRILVLDTIHGGADIADALQMRGDTVDAVDVYRGSGVPEQTAASRSYDLVTAPVHLNPSYPLLGKAPVKTHHEMVRELVVPPRISVEITGARGKTTTAFALAHLMTGTGRGILHTSSGTFRMPGTELLWRKSITPASVIAACTAAQNCNAAWLIAEESVGVAGFGTLGILTSADDYSIAGGTKSALLEKCRSLAACRTVLVPRGVPVHDGWQVIEDLVSVTGDVLSFDGGEVTNPLLTLAGYRAALSAAAAAALLLGLPVAQLGSFSALKGRMHLSAERGVPVLDNANSGTNADNTIEAAAYLRRMCPGRPVVLAIGMEHHAVCEGFPAGEVRRAVSAVRPAHLVIIAGADDCAGEFPDADTVCTTFPAATDAAVDLAKKTGGSVLLAAKTWR
ncbi:MAG: coenzyme F430 synthase [Methanocorpusculum sp.]|nr:coenzyme F430 synthase [Methanocorpusculum sp.]MDE2522400.1 coenzyme F430 synthase [Methanocorpusculum sp.]MDE2523850.1 coenzyme F430 synthase [Methanocorpusculum sp.]